MKKVLLGDIIELAYGKSLPQRSRVSGRFPVFGSNGQVDTHNKSLVGGPGIIVGRKGSVGEVIWSKQDFWPIDTTYYVKLKNLDDDLKYWYYVLKTLGLNKLNSHSAIPGLNRDVAYIKQVPLRSTLEQEKIADILSSLDEKIELNRRMNETLERLGQALFRHYFVDNPEAKNWDEGTLGDIMNITMGQSPPGKSYNNNGDGVVFYQGRADFGLRYPNIRLFTTDPKRFAKVGDVLLTVRAPVGDVNQASERCCIGRGLAAISSRTGAVSFCYYYCHQLKADFLEYNSEGTVFGSINSKQLKALKLKIPPIGLVEKFENEVAVIDKTIMLNSYQVKTLVVLRDSLLPKLISGGIEV